MKDRLTVFANNLGRFKNLLKKKTKNGTPLGTIISVTVLVPSLCDYGPG